MSTKVQRIDFRHTGWGHDCQLTRTSEVHETGAPIYRGHLFSGWKSPKIGTEIIVNQASGRPAIYVLTEVDWRLDPGDMFFVKAYPDRYLDED